MSRFFDKRLPALNSAEADRKAVRKIGFYSALAIIGIFMLSCIVFVFEADEYEAPPRQTVQFLMFDMQDIAAENPDFIQWLEAADPKKFAVPAGTDSCRNFHWEKISSSRSLPVPEVSVAPVVMEADELPGWSPVSGGNTFSGRGSLWNSRASMPVLSAGKTLVQTEGYQADFDWRPDAVLEKAAAEAEAEFSVISFKGGIFTGARIEEPGADSVIWKEQLTAAVMALAAGLDIPAGETLRLVIYWGGAE